MDLYNERDVWVGDIHLEMISINKTVEARGRNELISRKGVEVRYWDIKEKNKKTQTQCVKPDRINKYQFIFFFFKI